MKHYKIVFVYGEILEFKGEYRRDLERPHWHYYETENSDIVHCCKKTMLYVIQKSVKP